MGALMALLHAGLWDRGIHLCFCESLNHFIASCCIYLFLFTFDARAHDFQTEIKYTEYPACSKDWHVVVNNFGIVIIGKIRHGEGDGKCVHHIY